MKLLSLLLITLLFRAYDAKGSSSKATCVVKVATTRSSSSKEKESKFPLENIFDNHTGVLAEFKTQNVLRIKDISNNEYIDASFSNQTLQLFTTEKFKFYEINSKRGKTEIEIKMSLDCHKNSKEFKMKIYQTINDYNNHYPEFNKKEYSYAFGMNIPANLRISEALPILVTDHDITNRRITFNIDNETYFRLESSKDTVDKNGKTWEAYLIATKEIFSPFNTTLMLTATDFGTPSLHSTVPITVTVNNIIPQNIQARAEDMVHPPVFSSYMYYSTYSTDHKFQLNPIPISYGYTKKSYIKQTGYEQFFSSEIKNGSVIVTKTNDLSEEVLNSLNFITLEIEAYNTGINIPGRIIVLIHMLNNTRKPNAIATDCSIVVKNPYYINSYIVPLMLFAISVCSIVFINTYLIVLFVQKKKQQYIKNRF